MRCLRGADWQCALEIKGLTERTLGFQRGVFSGKTASPWGYFYPFSFNCNIAREQIEIWVCLYSSKGQWERRTECLASLSFDNFIIQTGMSFKYCLLEPCVLCKSAPLFSPPLPSPPLLSFLPSSLSAPDYLTLPSCLSTCTSLKHLSSWCLVSWGRSVTR